MGSVASTNNGLSDLLQTLTNENSPLASTLSSPAIQAALEKAPASDIAEISDEAIQLQTAEAIFGTSDSSNSSSNSLFAALASESSAATSSATGSSLDPGSSIADQAAAYQGNLQSQETAALFDTGSNTPNSQFDVFA